MARSKKTSSSKRSAPSKPQVNFGRPQDGDLETHFMSKLRNGKLQEISAESQAQIDLYSFQDQKASKNSQPQTETITTKLQVILNFFKSIDQKRFNLLWSSFKHTCNTWQFKEINTILDFPQYLFLDQCDLSYVIHGVITSEIQELKEKTTIQDDQLLFLELICLASRNQVSFRILESIKENKDSVLKEMLRIKDDVKRFHSDIQKNKNMNRPNPNAIISENQPQDDIPDQLRQGNMRNVIQNSQSQQSSGQNNQGKTKPINKEGKKKGRPKKIVQSVQGPQKISFNQLLPVLKKLIDHISYAYAYVYEQQFLKSKSQQGMQGVIQCIN